MDAGVPTGVSFPAFIFNVGGALRAAIFSLALQGRGQGCGLAYMVAVISKVNVTLFYQ